MLSNAGLRESRSEGARAIGATTRPSPPEREPASAAGLAARSAAGVTGAKAVADPSSTNASSDLASMTMRPQGLPRADSEIFLPVAMHCVRIVLHLERFCN